MIECIGFCCLIVMVLIEDVNVVILVGDFGVFFGVFCIRLISWVDWFMMLLLWCILLMMFWLDLVMCRLIILVFIMMLLVCFIIFIVVFGLVGLFLIILNCFFG